MDLPPAAPTVRVVAYGRPATEALATAIAEAKDGHPLDPVTVLVASNLAGLSVRRLIGGGALGGHGLANVSFLTPLRLAELLAAEHLPGLPVTNAVLAAAARRVLRHRPAPFGPVADHHASEAAVVALYGELSRLRPETLARLADHDDHTRDLVAVFHSVQDEVAGRYYDEDERARAAVERLRDDRAAAAAQIGRLVWFLPERLTPAQATLVGGALTTVPSSIVVGLTGDPTADAAVRATCAAAGVELPAARPGPVPTGTRILSVSDPDEEVRVVCREILALAEAGTPLDRIGVLHPAPDPYARSLHEQLAAANLPHNGPSRTRLADGVAGRTLLDALALPERSWGRADVLAVASAGPLRHEGHVLPTPAWEHVSRAAGVVAGLDDWADKLEAFAQQRTADHRRLGEDPANGSGYLAAVLDEAERARSLGRWVAAMAVHVDALDQAKGWTGKAAQAQALLDHLVGSGGRRGHWPEPEQVAADRVEAALARLALLDDLDPDPSTLTFRRAVEAELDQPAGRVGRFGHGVVFGPLSIAPGLDLDVVFVLGLAEGTCPSPRGEDALLPDEVRTLAGDELTTREEGLRRQHRHLLTALAAGGTHRVLVFPRGDLRGNRSRLPSRWLLDTATALRGGGRVHSSEFGGLGETVVDQVRSYAHGLAAAPAAVSLVERDLAVLDARWRAGGDPATDPAAGPDLRRGLEAQAARRSTAFTVWDGNLAGAGIPSPSGGRRLSASAMQSWAACPFRYFLGQVLRLGERPEPETVTEIAATDRGTLLHEVLERFVREAIERDGGPPAPGEHWSDDDRTRLLAIADEVFGRFRGEGKTGRELLWRLERELLLGDLDRFVDLDDERRAEQASTPIAVEQPFGLDDEPPLTLDIGGGRTLAFRGYIDRVDATATGGHVVYDYKSGSGSTYGGLDDDPVRQGQVLQLGLYAEAVAQRYGGEVASWFWMVNSTGDYKRYGGPWTDARRARFLDVLAAITDGIEAGTFPPRPGELNLFFRQHANCRYCAFDRLCPRDRHEQERAKAGAPELAVLARLLPADDGADESDEEAT